MTKEDFSEYKQKLESTLNEWKSKVESHFQFAPVSAPDFVVHHTTIAETVSNAKPSSKFSSRRVSTTSQNKENLRPVVNSQLNPKEEARRELLVSLKPNITNQ